MEIDRIALLPLFTAIVGFLHAGCWHNRYAQVNRARIVAGTG
jgi:hypothetical protein